MNQNMNQSQNQVQQLTPEELQKTQVLNLQEVEETIRFEKATTKKPAIIVAIIGILSITIGSSFQVVSGLSAKKQENTIQKKEVIEEPIVEKAATESLTCKKELLNEPDGTDIHFTIQYTFEDDKLVSFKKENIIMPTPGVEAGPQRIEQYKVDYQPFLNPTVGYQITLSPKDVTGIVVTVQADYEILDLATLSPVQNNHYSTSLDYPKDTTLEVIQADSVAKGFICQ